MVIKYKCVICGKECKEHFRTFKEKKRFRKTCGNKICKCYISKLMTFKSQKQKKTLKEIKNHIKFVELKHTILLEIYNKKQKENR